MESPIQPADPADSYDDAVTNDDLNPPRLPGMRFGQALPMILNGAKMSRIAWRGAYRYVFLQVISDRDGSTQRIAATIDDDLGPRTIKFEILGPPGYWSEEAASSCLTVAWTPTIPDLQADDWEVYETERQSGPWLDKLRLAVAKHNAELWRRSAEARRTSYEPPKDAPSYPKWIPVVIVTQIIGLAAFLAWWLR